MNTKKKAKIINALDQICEEQNVAIDTLVERLIGVCFSDKEAAELVTFYDKQNE